MPLTEKGKKILRAMEKTYGSRKKAKQVLYASKNAGKITGIDMHSEHDEHIGFKKLEHELAHKKGIQNPRAVAAAIGFKKYGKQEMERKAHAGRDDVADLPEELEQFCNDVERLRESLDSLAEHLGVEVPEEEEQEDEEE
jgi:hypothetical protein